MGCCTILQFCTGRFICSRRIKVHPVYVFKRKTSQQGKTMNCTRGNTEVKENGLMSESGVYSSIWRPHPFCLQGRRISDIFQSANHRPKSPSEIINIHLSLPSFKLYNKNGLSSSGLNNKLAPSGRRHRAQKRKRVHWRLNNNILWVLRDYSSIFLTSFSSMVFKDISYFY